MRQLIGLILRIAKTRFSLATLELQEARKRVFLVFALSLGVLLLALLCLGSLTVLLSLLLRQFFSLEHILLAWVLFYLCLTVVVAYYLFSVVHGTRGKWFAVTRAELTKDYEILRRIKE